MNLDFNSDKPIFLQISEGLADDILSGIFPEESQISIDYGIFSNL